MVGNKGSMHANINPTSALSYLECPLKLILLISNIRSESFCNMSAKRSKSQNKMYTFLQITFANLRLLDYPV